MSTNVTKLMAGYAAQRGISAAEVAALQQKVGSADATEQAQLSAARRRHLDAFTPEALTAFDRFATGAKLGVEPFHKLWKVDQDAGFRARWGITSKHDPKAPTFLEPLPAGRVPAALRASFLRHVEADRRAAIRDGYDSLEREAVTLSQAQRILDREGRPVGYDLTWRAAGTSFFVEKFYRLDGTFVGGDRTFPEP